MPRFSIRDLLWLTLVIGVGCGWYAHLVSVTAHFNKFRDNYWKQRGILEREIKAITLDKQDLEGDIKELTRQNDMMFALQRVWKHENGQLREEMEKLRAQLDERK
jgi:peptidoglycan hydrolase CwlO-like protein